METTTHTPSNGEALLTFEQKTIQALIALEHRRLDLKERLALADAQSDQARFEADAQFAAERKRNAECVVELVETIVPIVLKAFGMGNSPSPPAVATPLPSDDEDELAPESEQANGAAPFAGFAAEGSRAAHV